MFCSLAAGSPLACREQEASSAGVMKTRSVKQICREKLDSPKDDLTGELGFIWRLSPSIRFGADIMTKSF